MINNTSSIKELEKYQSDYEKRAKAIEAISQEITLIGVGGGGVNFLANAKQKLRASYTFLEYNLSQVPNIEEMLLGVKPFIPLYFIRRADWLKDYATYSKSSTVNGYSYLCGSSFPRYP